MIWLWVLADHVQERLASLLPDRLEAPLEGRTDLFWVLNPLPVPAKGFADLFKMDARLQFAQRKLIRPDRPAVGVHGPGSPLDRLVALVVIHHNEDRQLVGMGHKMTRAGDPEHIAAIPYGGDHRTIGGRSCTSSLTLEPLPSI